MSAEIEVTGSTWDECSAKAVEAFNEFYGNRDGWVFDGHSSEPECYVKGRETPALWRTTFRALKK